MIAASVSAFAQTVDSEKGGSATITVANAAKGETYKVVKLFSATYNTTTETISYTGTVPAALSEYFEAKDNGIVIKEGASIDGEDAATDLKAWADTQTPAASAVSDGSTLEFTNLEYGYYVVTTTQGALVAVNSLKPTATVTDKNQKTPELSKDVDDEEYNIGDTVNYTVTYNAPAYEGAGEDAKQVTEYTITDTLPDYLDDVEVTSITIDGEDYTVNEEVPQFVSKKITIPWVDSNGNTLYKNNAEVVITYTATLTDEATIDGEGNTNTVDLTWKVKDDDTDHGELHDSETIYTYALALKKVDDKGNALAGAEFQLPFYVKETADDDGAYIYAGTAAGEGLVNTLTTPTSGEITIKGMKSGDYTFSEKTAPEGYNKLDGDFTVTAQKTGESVTTTITKYLDANGNVTDEETTTTVTYANTKVPVYEFGAVVNKQGAELPSTGGMGTTILYIAGSVLVLAAAILLVTKRRMGAED